MNTTWTIEEKKKLLIALQKHGTNNIAEIQKLLPEKTITEIRFAFEKYSRLAHNKMNQQEKLREEDSAINQWIKIIKKTQVRNNTVYDIVPRVLKYIALYEKRPNDKDVNLSDCYTAISEMSNGMVSKNLTPTTNYFFYENLSRLALQIKKDDISKQKRFLKHLNNLDHVFKPQPLKTYNRNKKRVNIPLNPLNVPDELLKIDSECTENNK